MYISKRAINKSLVRLRKNALRDRAFPAGGCIRTTCQRTMGQIGLNLKASYINLKSRASWGFIYRPYHVTKVGPSWARKLGGKLHDSLRWLGCNALMTNTQLNIHTHKKYEIHNVTDLQLLGAESGAYKT